jgi:threonine 3-dehydrogenase
VICAPAESLSTLVYNIGAFNPSPDEFAARMRAAFPGAQITFAPDLKRQAIVDSWPEDVDDTLARRDWGFAPAYDLDRTVDEYLLPTIRQLYANP